MRRSTKTLLFALILAGAGCVSPGDEPPARGIALGAWQFTRNGCTQHLLLQSDGGFRFATRLHLGEAPWSREVTGTVQAAGGGAVTFAPDNALSPEGLFYCGQWERSIQTPLPEADFEARSGLTLADLVFQAFNTAALGRVLVGSDGERNARLLLYRGVGGNLRGILPRPARNLARPTDANRTLVRAGGLAPVPVPGGFYNRTFPAAAVGTVHEGLVLNVVGAVRLTFSGGNGSDLATCDFVVHTDQLFNQPAPDSPLSANVESQTLNLNPAQPAPYLFPYTVLGSEPPRSAYLLPVAIQAPSAGACRAQVKAEPLVIAELREALATGTENEAFSVSLSPGAGAHLPLLVSPSGLIRLVRLAPGEVHGGAVRLAPWVGTLPGLLPPPGTPPEATDPLGFVAAQVPVWVSAGTDTGGPALHLVSGSTGSSVLGPFLPVAAPPTTPLPVPTGTLTGIAIGAGERVVFAFTLGASERLAFSSTGGVHLRARLMGSDGVVWAEGNGGAPAGEGFLLLRTLPAGDYRLETRAATTGVFDLAVAPWPDAGFADENLEGCLVAVGLLRKAASDFLSLSCPRHGITALGGLEQATALRFLDLSDNGLTDVSPLAALLLLEALSLARNPLSGLSPLGALPRLRRLSLAEVPLDESALAVLTTLATSLAYLDLRGVTTLTPAQVAGLKDEMPLAVLVAPDGTVLE